MRNISCESLEIDTRWTGLSVNSDAPHSAEERYNMFLHLTHFPFRSGQSLTTHFSTFTVRRTMTHAANRCVHNNDSASKQQQQPHQQQQGGLSRTHYNRIPGPPSPSSCSPLPFLGVIKSCFQAAEPVEKVARLCCCVAGVTKSNRGRGGEATSL